MANKVSQREVNARLTIRLLSGVSIVAAAFAIYLGLRHDQSPAIIALVLAIAVGIAAGLSYRRYIVLRDVRWQAELAESNKELDLILSEPRTGATPSGSASAVDSSDQDTPPMKPEENPFANR